MTALSLGDAQAIVGAAMRHGTANGLKPLAVIVLDSGGHVQAFARGDGASHGRFDIARGKASGALALGVGSRALLARAEQQPFFITAAGAALVGGLVPVPGGVLIRSNGSVVGCVGVSGDTSDEDERAAIAAIEAAGFTADPG